MSNKQASTTRQISKDDEWTVIDPEEELEGAVVGLGNGDVGASLMVGVDPLSSADLQALGELSEAQLSNLLDTPRSNSSNDEQVNDLRAQIARLQEQLRVTTQENEALHSETARLAQSAKVSKEILAKYVNEKEALERSAVDAEEISTASMQFMSASQARLHCLAENSRHMRLKLSREESNEKQEEGYHTHQCADSQPNFHPRSFETAILSMETMISDLEGEFSALGTQLEESLEQFKRSGGGGDYKISLTSFHVGDLALFFPTPHGDFLAFNAACPHHYLSEESKSLIGQDKHFRKFYVLGKVVFMEEAVASREHNPFKLPIGTVFKIVSVTSVTQVIERRGGSSGGAVASGM